MYAKWIADDCYVGSSFNPILAIKKGEVRKIHAKNGKKYVLEGRNGQGYFGWTDEKNLEIMEIK